jgi:hypothetical protein
MSRRLIGILAAGVSVLWVTAPLPAQARFDVLAQQAVSEVSGLRVVTIRDRPSSECYTLFIFESTPPEPAVATADPAAEAAQASVRRIQEAAVKRERQLAELQPTGALKQATDFPSVIRPPDTARLKIEEEFERTLREELPGGPPWASLVPGVRTGGSEDLSNDLRRARLDPDPASPMKTMEDQLARLDALLRRLIEQPRLAASGPVPCPAAAREQP